MEFDDEEDEPDDDSGETTVACPHCRRPVYEDSERCPECGHYLSREDRPWNRPIWLIVGVAICLAIVVWWTFR